MPSEAGLYFAKSKKEMKWFDLIVDVQGESPMLYISYALDRGALTGPRLVAMKPFEVAEWGRKIET